MNAETGPVLLVHVVTPAEPVITQVGEPRGDVPFVGAVTVAVKSIVEPRLAEAELAITPIVTAPFGTTCTNVFEATLV